VSGLSALRASVRSGAGGVSSAIKTSFRTFSARLDAAGPAISWGVLVFVAASAVYCCFALVIPNVMKRAEVVQRLEERDADIAREKQAARELNDKIRAMDNPYHVAQMATSLGFVPVKPVVPEPAKTGGKAAVKDGGKTAAKDPGKPTSKDTGKTAPKASAPAPKAGK
jgi:hypothetical protein